MIRDEIVMPCPCCGEPLKVLYIDGEVRLSADENTITIAERGNTSPLCYEFGEKGGEENGE